MFGILTPAQVQKSIADGGFKPNIRLTNLSTAYFQAEDDFVATKLFPASASPAFISRVLPVFESRSCKG